MGILLLRRMTVHSLDPILNQTRNQISARLLLRLAEKTEWLAGCLTHTTGETTSESRVAEVQQALRRVYFWAVVHKVLNSILFFLTLGILLGGSFFQVLNLFWVRIDSPFIAGLIEAFLLVVLGGLSLSLYRRNKHQQSWLEDTMRQTLFASESLEEKQRRLAMNPSQSTSKSRSSYASFEEIYQEASQPGTLSAKLEDCLGRKPSEVEQQIILAQLTDTRIKAYSYRNISRAATVFLILSVVSALAWSYVAPILFGLTDPTALGTIQSVLLLGVGGLCLTTRNQYVRRQRQAEEGMTLTLTEKESIQSKSNRLIQNLRTIDTGLEKTEDTKL